MAIVRWEPFRDLVSIQDRMNRIFDDAFRGARQGDDDWALGGTWAPPVDIYEHDGNLVLKAELPGIDPKDVDVRVENNVLSLRGERRFDQEVKRESCHRVERAYGTFSRSFTLPNVVDTGNIKAEFKDGVLRVTMPKREEAKPKQIQIQVGTK
ncbi:MAG TPA: Hsp20/alpha crystallin family protein [Vicinamibacteria bacterium]|nr:Hsp20/alpha crystallin family protein [Vicinamibacteria bacterium]